MSNLRGTEPTALTEQTPPSWLGFSWASRTWDPVAPPGGKIQRLRGGWVAGLLPEAGDRSTDRVLTTAGNPAGDSPGQPAQIGAATGHM